MSSSYSRKKAVKAYIHNEMKLPIPEIDDLSVIMAEGGVYGYRFTFHGKPFGLIMNANKYPIEIKQVTV